MTVLIDIMLYGMVFIDDLSGNVIGGFLQIKSGYPGERGTYLLPFTNPISVANRIGRLQRYYCEVAWEMSSHIICWCFGIGDVCLWRHVVAVKYGEEWGGWSTKPV